MKFPLRHALAILLTVIAVSSFAGNGPASGCKPLGSWLGYDQYGSAWWMTTTDGQSASHGTLNLEAPGAAAILRYDFPDVAAVTEMRGIWEKAGSNLVAWTVVGFAYDAAGTTLALARLSGKSTLSKDCNSEHITDTLLEVFAPDADVDSAEALWTMPFPPHEGYRVKLVTFDQP